MILDTIQTHMQEAMKAHNQHRVDTLRGLISELKKWKTDNPGREYTEEIELQTLRRAVKQRNDSIEQFEKGGRPELAVSEKEELKIISEYLPTLMSEEDVAKVVMAKKVELGITDKSGMGKLMGAVMQELKGKADGSVVKQVVENSI